MAARSELPPAGPPLVFAADLDAPELAPEDHHHLARVLRVRPGDPVTVADGSGRWVAAAFGRRPEPRGPAAMAPSLRPPITVAFALVKGDRPEWVVQKLTELGVDRIVAFVAERSVVRWDPARAERHLARLAKVARQAAMQCRRARLPEVGQAAGFAELAALPGVAMADPGGAPPSLVHPTVLVGPEGGWSDEERAASVARVALGDHVLRTETAAVAAGGLLAALRRGLVQPSGGGSVVARGSAPT